MERLLGSSPSDRERERERERERSEKMVCGDGSQKWDIIESWNRERRLDG